MRHCWPRRRTATVIELEERPPRPLNYQFQFIYLLENLEKEEKLFASHDLLETITGFEIEAFIDSYLTELLGCKLRELSDSALAERICKAFFKRKEVIKDWKSNSQYPIFEGLLLTYIFHCMRKLLLAIHEPLIAEGYEKMRNKMDALCTDLLQVCFRDNEERTRRALNLNYHRFIHTGECSFHRIRLMEIAYVAKANKFLAHPACQKEIDRRWQPSYRIGPSSTALYLYYCLPILFFFERTEPYAKNPSQPFWARLKGFYTSTSSKYVIHMAFRCAYVFFYSATLIQLNGKDIQKMDIFDFWEQFGIMIWQCSYLLEMVLIAFKKKFLWWADRNKVDFYRNIIISINVVTLILGLLVISWRYFLLPIADLCFYISYIIAVIRSMRVLYVDSFFGSIVYMINKMVPIMVKFFLIFLFFWLAFAVCYISLSGHIFENNSTYVALPWQMFYHGAFEIFGEAIDDDKKGFIPSCKNFDVNFITDTSFHCLFRTWMIPLLLFFYILVSGILLVNILTALLTKKYDDISKDYHTYWKVALYARLAEYEDSLFVPAPLSIIYYIIEFICVLVVYVVKFAKRFSTSFFICRRTRTAEASSMEMLPLKSGHAPPPTPTLAKAMKTMPTSPLSSIDQSDAAVFTLDSVQGIQSDSEIEEPRPNQLSLPDDIKIRPKKPFFAIRPHSALDMPTFLPQSSVTPTHPPSEDGQWPPTPKEAIESAMVLATDAIRMISAENEEEEDALTFIRNCKHKMVHDQNEENQQKRVQQEVMERILQKFDLTFAIRARGMTE